MKTIVLVPSCGEISKQDFSNENVDAQRTRWRCNCAIAIARGSADLVIFSGGKIRGSSEPHAMRMQHQYSLWFTCEAAVEPLAHDTVENVLFSIEIAKKKFAGEGLRFIVVSEKQHLRRFGIILLAAVRRGDLDSFQLVVSNPEYKDGPIGSALETFGYICHFLSPTGKDPFTRFIRWLRSR